MALDIDKAGDTVDKASGFFDKLNAFIKKHPIWFVLIVIAGLVYWASTLPEEEVDHAAFDEVYYESHSTEIVEEPYYEDTDVEQKVITKEQHVQAEVEEEYYITKKTYFVDSIYRTGDTVYVDYYSDGYKEKYYKDDWAAYEE